jgi:hypothetical protein
MFALHNQRIIEENSPILTVGLDVMLPRLGEPVEEEVVFPIVDLFQKPAAELLELHFVHLVFKDRLLYPLAIVLADLCNAAQSSPAGLCLGDDIIGDDNSHKHLI